MITPKELVQEVRSRHQEHQAQVYLIERKIRELKQDLEKYIGWMQEARAEAREMSVDVG